MAGIPVTHRGVTHDLTIVSGHLPPGHPESLVQWGALASLRGTIVLMMAVENAPLIAEVLLRGGRDARTPVAVVCDGTMPTERTVLSTLGDLGATTSSTHEVHPRRSSSSARSWRVAHPSTTRLRGRQALSVATYVEIDDPADPRLADYRDLRDVQLRQSLEAEHGLFLAEGEKVVRRAAEAGFPVRSFLMAPRWLDGLDDVLERTDAPCYVVSEAARRAGHRLPRPPRRAGLAGRAPRCRPSTRCSRAPAPSSSARTSSTTPTSAPSSVSAAALGVDAVLLAPRCADPLYRRSVKVAMGAVFALPWTRLPDWYDALPDLGRRGFTTVALTLADDAVPLEEAVSGLDRLALVLGSEGHGLSERWQRSADRRAVIPMRAGHRLAQRGGRDRGRLLRSVAEGIAPER